jgi:glycosyltransferase involved in cell wall biosynthesis
MVSRLQHKKDHISLLAGFDDLRQRHSDRKFRLHIGGDGATREEIEAEIGRRNLESSVILHGVLDQDGVRDLLRSLDFYVHATFGETMSNSIMQAMATELPIVASDVNGVSNMLKDGCGALYPSQDAIALADQLDRWIARPDEALAFARRARQRAESDYDVKQIVRMYEELVGRE